RPSCCSRRQPRSWIVVTSRLLTRPPLLSEAFGRRVMGGFVMKRRLGLCVTAFLAGLLAVPSRAGEVGDYLTKDGQLKEAGTFKTIYFGFLAPPGEVWGIEPSGAWTTKLTASQGKLSAPQLAALAQHLATQDFNSLPQKQGYEPDGASYQYV